MSENIKIALETRVLNGLNIHLILNINIDSIADGYRFMLNVPINDYYPRSKLFSSPIVQEIGLFNAIIETIDKNNMSKYCNAQNKLGFTTSLGLYLKTMYNAAKYNTVTTEERSMLMGIERKVFYTSFKYIVNKYNIDVYNTLIICDLEETCSTNDVRLNKYLSLDYEILVEYYQNICPYKSPKRLITTHENLARRIVCHEESMKRKLFLSTILGMKRIDDNIMATLLSIFMEKCMSNEN